MISDESRGASPYAGLGFAIALATLAVDQAVKLWLLLGFDLADRGAVRLLPVADLVLLWNKGISYSLFEQNSLAGRIALIAVAVVAAVLLGLWLRRERSLAGAIGLGFIIGGALGNAVDRIAWGAVVDFLLLHWGTWNWYVFNVADAAIVVGVALLLYAALNRPRAATADAGGDG
ncbi:MAG TPA: signal peptidase II [Hyphomicrobiales bacterium]|nr:signal peptidase II [Hyphomicrobiales bacterium]